MFESILNAFKGEIALEEAEKKILETFYERTDELMLDLERERRQGFPEVVLHLERQPST